MSRKADEMDHHIGMKLKMLRVSKNMSQGNLAKDLGITFQQVQKYEKATNRISASRLYEIASILNVDIHYFFNEHKNKNEIHENNKVLEEYCNSLKGKSSLNNNDIILKLLNMPSGEQKTALLEAISNKISEAQAA